MAISCTNCDGNILKRQAKGEFFSFGEFGKVRLTQDLEIRFCDKCHETYLLMDDSSLDDALEASLSENVREVLEEIKSRHSIKAKEIANFCGITPETLSRFKQSGENGRLVPSEIFLILKRIAIEGRSFIDKALNETWERKENPRAVRPYADNPQNSRFDLDLVVYSRHGHIVAFEAKNAGWSQGTNQTRTSINRMKYVFDNERESLWHASRFSTFNNSELLPVSRLECKSRNQRAK
jgi:hypothetical protein